MTGFLKLILHHWSGIKPFLEICKPLGSIFRGHLFYIFGHVRMGLHYMIHRIFYHFFSRVARNHKITRSWATHLGASHLLHNA